MDELNKEQKDVSKEALDSKIREIKKKTDEIIELEQIESLVQTNVLEFEVAKVKYRVRKPTYEERLEVNKRRAKKYTELLKDETMMLEEDLIKIYKKRGIDIEEMNSEYSSLEKRKNELLSKLGKALKEGKPDTELIDMRKELESLLESMQHLQLKKLVLLDSSIESQIQVYTYTYLTFLLTEKYITEQRIEEDTTVSVSEWRKAWNTYDELLASDEFLVNNAIWHTGLVSRNEIQSL